MEVKKTPKADLENKKFLFREIGLVIALAAILLAFEWETYEKNVSSLDRDTAVVIEEELVPITNETPPPPPPAPSIPVVSDEIMIVDDDMKITTDLVINTEDDEKIGVQLKDYVSGNGTGDYVEEEEIPFMIVEEKPKFQGEDENAFTKWVYDRLVYPDIAKENGVQGKVTISFLVNTDGSISDVKILRGVDSSLDKEAIRVISSSPKWTPGKQRNKPVKVRFNFPIIFQLR